MRTKLLVGLVALALHAADDTPGWLKDLISTQLPQYPAKVNSVVLLDEEHTTAADSGRLTTVTRTAIKILNRPRHLVRHAGRFRRCQVPKL